MAKTNKQLQEADESQDKSKVQLNAMLPAIVEAVGGEAKPTYLNVKQQYDVMEHDVFNVALNKRPDKKKSDGSTVKVNRIGLPLQKLIVNRRVAFMNVGRIQLEANPKGELEERIYNLVLKIREDNKINFIEKEIARRMLSELQVAKLWYSEKVEAGYYGDLAPKSQFRMRCKVLSPDLGDTLLPVFDDNGKLVYFGRLYESRRSYAEVLADASLVSTYASEKDQRFDIYSDTHIYKFRKARSGETIVSTENNSGWVLDSVITHSYGKIPVTYYSKQTPPWADVQHAIDRLEAVFSNFADTNDYHASPTLVFIGKIGAKMLEKGEQGKAVEIAPVNNTNQADVKYVTWDQAVDATKLEIENLVDQIFSNTQTPNISFKAMSEIGVQSGVAFDRIFVDAHLAARDELDGEYGQSTQRDINLCKAFAATINTSLKPAQNRLSISFDAPLFRINDDSETISTLSTAHKAGMLSQKTMVDYSPLTKNSEEELEQIKKEQMEAMALEKKNNMPATE